MYKVYIGIDNGVTGSIGILGEKYSDYLLTPIIREQNYTKAKDIISRVDANALRDLFRKVLESNECKNDEVMVVFERPMLNPQRWKASISAARAIECELSVVESFSFPHMYCDSKEWQKVLLPHNLIGSSEQKKASRDIGCRLFPQFKDLIDRHKDADGILISEWARRKF